MLPLSLLGKIGLYVVLPVAVLIGSGMCIYTFGEEDGSAAVQKKWDTDVRQRNAAAQKLKDENHQKELDHAHESQQAADALQQASEAHAKELAAVRSEFARSLQRSDARAAIYQREAAGGAAQCAGLASHTAELDRSLVEGQDVVRELIATIGLRDDQLVQVGKQLLADRKLLNGPN